MRAMSVLRFVVLGAVGFGLVGVIPLPLNVLIGGAVGGASLGLALKDWRRVVILALLGEVGLIVGVFAGLALGSFFFNYSEVPIVAMVGAVVGASLGAAFGDWRTIVALAVAGAVGFSVGNLPADSLRFSIPILRQLGEGGSIVIIGIIGGASLGAALGYLEQRRLAEGQRPRVR
jgi:fucose permease